MLASQIILVSMSNETIAYVLRGVVYEMSWIKTHYQFNIYATDFTNTTELLYYNSCMQLLLLNGELNTHYGLHILRVYLKI